LQHHSTITAASLGVTPDDVLLMNTASEVILACISIGHRSITQHHSTVTAATLEATTDHVQ
jgi:hypothetical protein